MSHFVAPILPCLEQILLHLLSTLSCRRHGLDQCSVGDPCAAAAAPPGSRRWPGSTVERPTRCAQRHSLDLAYGSPLEGHARALSAIPDVPSALPTVGPERRARKRLASAGQRSGGTRRIRPPRELHRRFIRVGEKRGPCVGKTKRGKGTKIMAIADGAGLPISVWIASASPHEITLVEPTLDQMFVTKVPPKLIGDKAYDSDGLDARLLAERNIELIAPHRSNRKIPTQDGRPLRRSRRRWQIERVFAWFQNYRRLVVRYEYHADNFQGFLHLACIILLLKHL